MSDAPVLRIVHGHPDDAEIAAVTTALIAVRSATAAPPPPAPMSLWADRAAALRHPQGRRPLRPGQHAWRASTLPG
jgi:hypothetical protein